MIHAYKNPALVCTLVGQIFREGDSVLVHFDKKSPLEEYRLLQNGLAKFSGTRTYRTHRMYWGGSEIVECDVFLSSQLIKSSAPFDFVIHLTGTSFPVVSQEVLRRFLSREMHKSFVTTTPLGHLLSSNAQATEKHDPELEDRVRFAIEHFGVWRNRPYTSKRSKPSAHLLVRRLQFDLEVLPYRVSAKIRKSLGLPSLESPLPRALPRIYRGFVHDMICRDHFLAVHKSPVVRDFLKQLRNVSCPDEVFYHTMLRGMVNEQEIVNNNYLYTDWRVGNASPAVLGQADLPLACQSGAFFARKIESVEVAVQLAQMVAERSSDSVSE